MQNLIGKVLWLLLPDDKSRHPCRPDSATSNLATQLNLGSCSSVCDSNTGFFLEAGTPRQLQINISRLSQSASNASEFYAVIQSAENWRETLQTTLEHHPQAMGFEVGSQRLLRSGAEAVSREYTTDKVLLLQQSLHNLLPRSLKSFRDKSLLLISSPQTTTLARIIATISDQSGQDISIQDLIQISVTPMNMAIVFIKTKQHEILVLKLGLCTRSNASLQSEISHQLDCNKFSGQQPLHATLAPAIICHGSHNDHFFKVENYIDGAPGLAYMYHFGKRELIINNILAWLSDLNLSYPGKPLAETFKLEPSVENLKTHGKLSETLCKALREKIRKNISQYNLHSTLMHGDLWLGNVVVAPQSLQINGILDWDQCDPEGLPMADLFNLLIHRKGWLRGFNPGAGILHLLDKKINRRDLLRIHKHMKSLNLADKSYHTLLILYWLYYFQSRLPQLGKQQKWIDNTLDPACQWLKSHMHSL